MVTYAFEEGDASFNNSYSGNPKANFITNHRPSKIQITKKGIPISVKRSSYDNSLVGDYIQKPPPAYNLPHLPSDLGEKHKPIEKLTLRVEEHLQEFEPIKAQEFISAPLKIRDFAEESSRMLGE